MTVVYTYLASDNARNRRRAKRAAEREQTEGERRIDRLMTKAITQCSERVLKATDSSGDYAKQLDKAIKHHEPITQRREERLRNKHLQVCNEANRQIHAVQKRKGSSIPAYFD